MQNFIYLLLFILTINSYSLEFNKKDSCIYSFKAKSPYDAELKMEIKDLTDKNIKLLITQRNGALTTKKEVALPKNLTKENILNNFLKVMKTYNKKNIILKNSKLIDNYKFTFKSKKYIGYFIKANIVIDKKLYKVSYIFSEELPLLGLFRFTITQDVKSKKNYKFKNIMLIKECNIKGKLIKL